MSDDLSSDILEEQFGPTSVKVLKHGPAGRVISTVAGDTALEFSLVAFGKGAAAFPDVMRDMSAGKSMGKAFRDLGVPFRRSTRGVYAWSLSDGFRRRFDATGEATVVEVSITAGKDAVPYADILEVYSPAVDWPQTGTAPPGDVLATLKDFGELLTELNH